jgi:endoribonuclease Dicer
MNFILINVFFFDF